MFVYLSLSLSVLFLSIEVKTIRCSEVYIGIQG